MAKQLKVLMVAHGHPDYNPGGGEIAAYQLHKALNSQSDHTPDGEPEITSVFFARHDQEDLIHGGTPFAGTGRPGEVLFYSVMPDWFRFSQPDKARVWRDFRSFLELHKPDVVHFHHYFQLGLELIREVKQFNSATQVVLTLHEYMAICNNEGQMLKAQTKELCYESSPSACASCFKNRTPQDFFLRKQFIQSCFDQVDQFVAPSDFLKQRYVQWGLASNRIDVIENLLEAETAQAANAGLVPTLYKKTRPTDIPVEQSSEPTSNPVRTSDSGQGPLRLAYFGQINRFKGLDILLQAMKILPKNVLEKVHLSINGTGLEHQPEAFRNQIEQGMKSLKRSVTMNGRYRSNELPQLLGVTDWMIVPSIWWENSPVVILEAKKFGVPVICSNIGGMQEKVEHGKNGRHFLARRAESLAEQITWAVNNRSQREHYAQAMSNAYPGSEPYLQHRDMYLDLCSGVTENQPGLGVENTEPAGLGESIIPLRAAS